MAGKNKDKKLMDKDSTRRPSARQIGWAIVAVIAVLFIVLNNKKAEVNLIAASPKWPMWTLVIVSMAIGFALAKLTGGRRHRD